MPGRGETEWWRAAAWAGGLLLALPVVVIALLHSSAVATRLAEALVPRLAPWPHATWVSGRVDIDGLRTLTLRDVRVEGDSATAAGDGTGSAGDGPARGSGTVEDGYALVVPYARAQLRLLPLLGRRLVVPLVEVSGLHLAASLAADSVDAGRRSDDGAGRNGGWTVEIGRLVVTDASVRARLGAAPDSVVVVEEALVRVRGVRAGGKAAPAAVVDTAHVVLHAPGRSGGPIRISARAALEEGRLAVHGFRLSSGASLVTASGDLLLAAADSAEVEDVDFRFSAEPLALHDVAAVLPGLDTAGTVRVRGRAWGSGRALDVELRGRASDGSRLRVDGTLTPTSRGPLRYELTGRLADLDPAFWGGPEDVSGIDATLETSLHGPSLDSLSGRVSVRAAARRLGGGALERGTLEATLTEGVADFRLAAAAAPWGTLEASGTASPFADVPRYEARATLVQGRPLELGSTRLEGVSAEVRLEGSGASPLEASGRATVDVEGEIGGVALRDTRVTGSWSEASAKADLTLTLDAGRAEAVVEADWSDEEAVRLALPVLTARSLELAPLTGGSLAGALAVDGSGSMILGQPSSPRADLEGTLGPLTWEGDAVADSGRVVLEVRSGVASMEGGLFAAAGVVRLVGTARPFAPDLAWEVDRLEVSSLDLSRVRPGLPATDLSANLRMEGRVLDGREGAPSSRTDGASGREGATSRTNGGSGLERMVARGELSVRPSTVDGQPVDTAHVDLALEDGALEVRGAGEALDGRFALDARARPAAPVPTFELERLRLDGVRVDSTLAGPLGGVVTATLRASGALPPDSVPSLRGRLDLEPSPLDLGQVASGRATFSVEDARARLDARLGVPRGSARVAATGDLSRDSAGALSMDALEVDGRVDLPEGRRVLGADTLASALDARFGLAGARVRSGALDWSGSLSATGHWGEARLDSLAVDVRSEAGVLYLDTLLLASNVARGEGGGAVAFGEQTAARAEGVRARIVLDSLYAAHALSAVRPLSLRGGALSVEAARAPQGVRIDARLGAGGVLAGAFAADTLSASGAAVIDAGTLASASGRLGGENLGWGAAFLDGLGGELAHDGASTRFAVTAVPDSAHRFVVGGTAHTAERSVDLRVVTLVFPDEEWRLARPSSLTWGDSVRVRDLALVAGRHRIAVDGVLNRNGEQDLTVTLDSVSLDSAADLVGFGGVSALLDGSVRVVGPAHDVALEGGLSGHIGEATLDLSVRPEDGSLGVDLDLGLGGRALVARGRVPFPVSIATPAEPARGSREEGRLALSVSAEEFALGWLTPFLEPFGVAEWRAWLTADARVEGTLEDPMVTGSATLAGGGLQILEQGISYQEISADVGLVGDRLDVRSLHATAGGTADASGTVRLTSLARPELDLSARFDRFRALHNEWTRLGMSGDVSVTGDLAAPVVRGSVRFIDTDFFADRVGTAAGGTSVALTREDFEMLARYFGYTPEREDATVEDPLEPVAMDVAVALESDVWLRRRAQPEMQLQLGGSLDVRKEAGDSIQLFGTIEILPARSYVQELGRRFDVTAGTATFNGSIWGWQTDLEARYEVPSVRDPTAPEATITLAVSGGMDDLQLTLGSEPEMETADILSYIATGRPAASAVEFGQPEGGEGGVLGIGAALALDQAAAALERTAAESVGLDVVEIRHQGREGTTLIAGRYVSPRLFVGFEQPLALGVRDDDAVNGTVRGTEVELEYTAYEWLLLTLEGGQSTVRFFLRTRHAF